MKSLSLLFSSFLFLSQLVVPSAQAAEAPTKAKSAKLETAIFAAGCFWGVEEYFRKIPGVVETQVGYTGGTLKNPKYEQMHDGKSGHAEAVEIKFDPSKVSYNELLNGFFKMHDPTTKNRQGHDEGSQYRSAVFYENEKQKTEALAFKAKVEASKAWKAPIVTEISEAKIFWKAEDYHQKYLVKNPGGYDNHYVRNISFNK
jgi:methionine-S-sulfoxide reductase